MPESLLRTFISIPLANEIRKVGFDLKSRIDSSSKINWSGLHQIHLTLKFLGHTPPGSVPEILSVLNSCGKNLKPFDLKIQKTGCFPGLERPRVLYLGVGGSVAALESLFNDINTNLEPLGFPLEINKYKPHITLARIKYPQKNTPDISDFLNAEIREIVFKVNKFQFMSSQLFSNGPVYTILGTRFLKNNSV